MTSPPSATLYRLTMTALAAVFCSGASAQDATDLLKELRELKARVAELEAQRSAAPPTKPQWGMTPEQSAEFGRVALKVEALDDAREAAGLRGLKIAGYVDPTYIANRRQNRAGFQFLNRVDTASGGDGYNYDNSYFGAAVIDFTKETDSGTRWRLTLAPNRNAGSVVDGHSLVHEASVSVPLGEVQTRLIAGQLPDWSGYELLAANQNKLVTHNLLFDFTAPTAYTGAGLELVRGKWNVKTVLANMNGSRKTSGNRSPVLAYRADYARGEYQGVGFAGVHGKAANLRVGAGATNPVTGDAYDGRDARLDLFEVDTYFIRGDWTLQAQASIGRQQRAAIAADPVTGDLRTARWWGLSGLVAYKWSPRLEAVARLDHVRNRRHGGGLLGFNAADGRNGLGPDPAGDPEVGADRSALSLGLSWLYDANTTFKVEYRLDRASLPVFIDLKDGSANRSNQLLGASVVVSF